MVFIDDNILIKNYLLSNNGTQICQQRRVIVHRKLTNIM